MRKTMQVQELALPEVKLLTPRRFEDGRGWFSESYNAQAAEKAGIRAHFVQDNHSYSREPGTVRGLHYQAPPFAQDKLVRVIRGAILDVAVDARLGFPTYGRWVSAELSAENGRQLFVPAGFLHGFISQEPDTEVLYKVSNYYSKEAEGAVAWDDADLAIDWGACAGRAVLSEKDRAAPKWRDFVSPFG